MAPDDPRTPTMIYDTELSGFGAYRASTRPGSYFIHYRVKRQQRKKVIARVNEINVADARDEAARIKLAARQGTDLMAERKLEADQAKTLGEAYAEYLEVLKRRNASR
ncbi:integrase arm-type DNA-binding domain-containing protein, partial [Halococcus hamelinensis]|uniref:integrase arm-type DNA-binding domain-containing protein n=1 Tax=Halococcus hamelinensis TaxID=332168 RepID=UPI0013758544